MSSPKSRPAAVIFDMDGVLVDSNPFHLQKWVDLLIKHRIPFKPEDLPEQVLGHRNDTAFRYFFGPNLTAEQRHELGEELEDTFRRVFKPHVKPLPGLSALIADCHSAGVPMAVASSAMKKNVEFIVDELGFRPYFRCLVTGDEVARPKPDPEIYLRTARTLGVEPTACVAFEDSFVGIEAAKRAGMKCVAIASTFPAQALRQHTEADLVVPGFEEMTFRTVQKLFRGNANAPEAAGNT